MTGRGERGGVFRGRFGAALAVLAAIALSAACSTGGTSNSSTSGSGSTSSADVNSLPIDVVKTVSPSVVLIQTPDGLGSGEVYDTKGDIVTNAHVIGSATSFVVTVSSGKQLPGTLVG